MISKEQFFKKLNAIFSKKTPSPLPKISENTYNQIFKIPSQPLEQIFKTELEKIGGKAFICKNKNDLIQKLKNLIKQQNWQYIFCFQPHLQNLLKQANIQFHSDKTNFNNIQVAINDCEALVATTGSVIVSSKQSKSRQINVFAPQIIYICPKEKIYLTLQQAINQIINKYNDKPSQISIISGPSKTADIEKTLIFGMHGPKMVYVFIY